MHSIIRITIKTLFILSISVIAVPRPCDDNSFAHYLPEITEKIQRGYIFIEMEISKNRCIR